MARAQVDIDIRPSSRTNVNIGIQDAQPTASVDIDRNAISYNSLTNKPSINSVILKGNKTTSDLNISYNDLVDKPDLTVYALVTEAGYRIELVLDSEYKLSAKLYDKNNNLITTSNIIDLPIEESLVDVDYNSSSESLIFSYGSGETKTVVLTPLVETIRNDLAGHISNTNNPHSVTKSQVGLSNVDNTSDINKPISTATQTALNLKADTTYVDTELDKKQDTISDLSTIRSNASAGKSASDTISTYGNIVTHNVNEFATAQQGTKADSAIQPLDNISELTNDGDGTNPFITKAVESLDNYSTTQQMNSAIASHHDSTKQNVIDDLDTIRSNATAGKQASDTIATYGNIVTHNTSEFATAAQGSKADSALQVSDIENSVTSTATNKALSSNMGKELQDQINNLKARGRFLSVWNSGTGLPTTTPTTLPYTYKSGDYYVVGYTSTTNYRPEGQTFTGAASTTIETGEVGVNDTYYYDGSVWSLYHTVQPEVSFSSLAGSPYDNTNLANALNAKQDELTAGANVTIDSEGVISATDTTYSAGTRITINDNQISTSASEVSVGSEGTSTTKVKYITVNGTEYQMGSDDPTEYTTKLEEDLYTYTNIGKITGASQTNPVKVADAGDPLKDVFNAILGTEVDVNPTISQTGTTFVKSGQTGTTSVSGAEIGQSISAQTGTVTWHVTNAGTCSYGLKAGPYDTYSKTSQTQFNYPTKTRSVTVGGTAYNYQIAISYPVLNGCTLSVTAGTLVVDDSTNRILYCNLDNNRDVKVSIAIPANTSAASAITRFGQMTANVEFDAPVYNNNLVENFWTYLKASYTASGMTPPSQKSASSTAYTITAGTRYAYSKVIATTTVPTSNLNKQAAESTFHTNGADFNYAIGDYIYMYRTTSGLKVQTYVLGQWADVDYTEGNAVTVTQANGATCTYYPYRVGPMEGAGTAKYRV